MRADTPPLEDEQPPPSSVAGSSPGASPERDLPPASGLIRLNEQCAARCLAERLSLKPYQKQALDELATVRDLLQGSQRPSHVSAVIKCASESQDLRTAMCC